MESIAVSDPIKAMVNAKIIMAPMSGITDIPFRMMVRRFGCKFAFTEMVDVNSIYYKNKKAFSFLDKAKDEGPLGVQILGQDVEKIITVAKVCQDKGFELLDFNAGCPARKVIKGGKGSALLKEPKKLGMIINALVKALEIPITVKIRSGWDDDSINYFDIARIVESEGGKAICVHPRTRQQMYKGKPDHEIVRIIKENIKIPVFASGNMFSVADVDKVLKDTGCDGVYIARGSLGRPWIFKDLEDYFVMGEIVDNHPDFTFVKLTMQEQFRFNVEYYGEQRGMRRMYKHMCWYFKKRKNLDAVMKEFRKLTNYSDAIDFIDNIELDERGRLFLKVSPC